MRVFIGVILFGLLLLPGGAFAEAQGKEVEIVTRAEVEAVTVNDQGEKVAVLQPAEKVMPGDVVLFTNTVTNHGQEPAENIVITNAVPQHMTYVEQSAFGEKTTITFSVDGGKSFDLPANLKLPAADGSLILPAGPQDYTHIRWSWNEPLPGEQKEEVGFRARLN